MKHSKKTFIVSLSIVIIFLFIIPGILFSILNWGILPPAKLTPLVIHQTNRLINGKFNCTKTELTFFETYPYLGIRITDGQLTSSVITEEKIKDNNSSFHEIPADSLLSFQYATVSIQPLDFLFKNQISIKDLIIINPMIHGFVSKDKKANWEIIETDTTQQKDKKTSTDLPSISLQKIRIQNGRMIYNDKSSQTVAQIDGINFSVDGILSANQINQLAIKSNISSFFFKNPVYTLNNRLSVQLKTDIELAHDYSFLKLSNSDLRINDLPFTVNGFLENEGGQKKVDMKMNLKISDLNDLLKFIPSSYFQNIQDIEAKGSILVDGEMKGYWNDFTFPNLQLDVLINDGYCHLKKLKQGIDTMNMDLKVLLNGENPDSSFLAINQCYAKGKYLSLDLKGKVNSLTYNPTVETNLKGNIDFTSLGQEFFNPDTLSINGQIHADLSARFAAEDLLKSRLDRAYFFGQLDIDTFKAISKPLGFDIFVLNTHLSADTSLQNNQYLNRKDLMKFKLISDSLNISHKDGINTNISRLDFQAHTTPQIDTSAVQPITAKMEMDRIRTKISDSIWVIASQTVLQGGIKSSSNNKKLPTAAMLIQFDTLKCFSAPLRTSMALCNSNFGIEAFPNKDIFINNEVDSISDSILQKPNSTKRIAKDAIRPMSTTQKLLKQWSAHGKVSYSNCYIFSRSFPILVNIDSTTMAFNTSDIKLKDANVRIGKSILTLNGKLEKIRQALLQEGQLKGEINLSSHYIDGNQLVKALIAGALSTEIEQKEKGIDADSIEELTSLHPTDSIVTEQLDTTSTFLKIPAFVNMSLLTNIDSLDYKDLHLNGLNGEVIIKDRSINLKELNILSNMGNGKLTMFYSNTDSMSSKSGMNLDLKKIQVAKLISLFPSMDTLVPMLRSFEGVVDCEMSGTCNIDSTMAIDMPSLNAACYMHGDSMVLLDGETFTEISKTLMFKNKKRNLIDSISVDFAVKDNKIEVFPFQVEMDRYKVAVGGTHNLDMTFNYHISVLKSPVPFKLGINISGNLDDFKIRIGKCKYKNLFQPAKLAEMKQERINLRTNMKDIIRKRIEEISSKKDIE